MDHAIYTAMGAARQSLELQAVTANNLANASTPGFRSQLAAMRAVPIDGPSMATRTMVTASTPGVDISQGSMNYSGRPLDVALQQDGYLAVRLPDGTEAYTRNGNIQISADGQMTVQGYPLMGDNGPIEVPPQAAVTIAADGTISALNAGDSPNTIAQLGQIKRVRATAGEVMHGDDGLFHLTPETQQARGAQLANDPLIKIMPGVLEGSNVKAVEAMADMIANARSFEMQMKVIHSVDENEQRANQLLAMS
ncbi:flagellar basal body rod protein FlgF [Yersinia enterocolitica]|uniref:Flagellar basal-body rod protein FlgF n=1 Tax=Yersinia enterocolitica serotype O:8 / biotype 1B (strain NCTC 13174 / 8081) TaxID=393305 RepID=A1JT11_YERE8|nr:flagellar basal body rod protein FlgF [Yersinia enterocolitica]AJJ25252.1 flagellar basal-body rod protein flgF [Yersinia enterocolitica]CAL12597.1 flagellar basal-body rod protein FlgF [Yersinia enterocolitica subsp. enterocolitica 8081]CNG07528.1 flagellar basal body rod protein FlgF [Yersinia enterocolitica]CRY28395.1 flagellar basal body rod protein FlgF [Yersinia enterocolitica]HDL8281749.1 flagellar basal body rod protein FlgF [Yersinia enterocolitica]